ncbi:beta-glucosidase family protein [Amnibacterium endophyticum]|uniref:Beta-glucosidase n=1 Tax=Amnibacterium endophyticum TaxID=2109337 RepID=A0ABW4LDQ0_9MICO
MRDRDRWDDCVRRVRDEGVAPEDAADALLAAMTDRELLGLLDGGVPARRLFAIPRMIRTAPVVSAAVPRLGFPGFAFSDGPRGVVVGRSTSFPVAMARAATWDVALEQDVGRAIALEARAQGADYVPAVCVNLLRHPAWGRAQECFGEDPVLTARMGVALTRGLRPHVMACVKHFALNSMEDMRFEVDVRVSEADLHEVYLPHFRAVVDAGAESVMSAYNAVNGEHVDVNRRLLTDVLRDEWGFRGFVTSDWVFGTHDAIRSLEAGLDVEMPLRLRRARVLPAAARDGRLPRSLVLRSARRIVATRLGFEAARPLQEPVEVAGPEHRALARRVAARSMVLLRNESVGDAPVLPLRPGIGRVAVIGRLATQPNLGDHGSSRVRPPETSTPLDGLREALPDAEVVHEPGGPEAVAAAASADVAIVVVGMDHDDEGEAVVTPGVDVGVLGGVAALPPLRAALTGLARFATRFVRGGDRRLLRLHRADERLVEAGAAANPRTVVVLIGGSAITCPWRRAVPALLHAWYPGMEGGRALADVLTGAAEPAGRLPFAIPERAGDLQPFRRHARHVVYDRWWGQRVLDRDGVAAAFPFGSGLGWSACTCELIDHDLGSGVARVRVRNTGAAATSSVAQVYAADVRARRPVAQLLGFARVDVAPGVEALVEVPLDPGPTLRRDIATGRWHPRRGDWRVQAATRSPTGWSGAVPLVRHG